MADNAGLPVHAYVDVLKPVLLLIMAPIIGLPPLIFHVLTNPLTYIVSTLPLSDRVSILRSKFFFYAWRVMSPLFDSKDRPIKTPLMRKASGTVLEIGAGVGGNIMYYPSAVERLVLVEPNADMHPALRQKGNQAGFWEHDGSLLILGCGGAPSDERALNLAGVLPASIDTIMIIHVLCGIPNPAGAIEMYRRLLKPGGTFAFIEHVRSEESFSARAQSWYTSHIWQYMFDGCCLDRPTGAWIMGGPEAANTSALVTGKELAQDIDGTDKRVAERWSDYRIEAPGDQTQYAILPHVVGWAVKA